MRVGVADLKAHLSAHLRRVRDGETIVVTDRDRPVAKLVPVEEGASPGIVIRKARKPGRLQDVRLPPPANLKRDIVEVLLDLRQNER
jgi:prevent-host-death family protein